MITGYTCVSDCGSLSYTDANVYLCGFSTKYNGKTVHIDANGALPYFPTGNYNVKIPSDGPFYDLTKKIIPSNIGCIGTTNSNLNSSLVGKKSNYKISYGDMYVNIEIVYESNKYVP